MIPSRISAGSRPPSPFRTVSSFRNPFLGFRSPGLRLSCVVEIDVWLDSGILSVFSGGIHTEETQSNLIEYSYHSHCSNSPHPWHTLPLVDWSFSLLFDSLLETLSLCFSVSLASPGLYSSFTVFPLSLADYHRICCRHY